MSAEPFAAMHNPDDREFFQYRYCTGRTILRSKSLKGSDLPFIGVRETTPATSNVTLPTGDPRPVRRRHLLSSEEIRKGNAPPKSTWLSPTTAWRFSRTLSELRTMLFATGGTILVALLGGDMVSNEAKPALSRRTRRTDRAGTHRRIGGSLRSWEDTRGLLPVVNRLNSLVERVVEAGDQLRTAVCSECSPRTEDAAGGDALRAGTRVATGRGRVWRIANQCGLRYPLKSDLEGVVENLLWLLAA